MAFAYFALMATALIGMQTFSVTALVAIYEAPLTLATGSLTGFLLGSAAGVLVGASSLTAAPDTMSWPGRACSWAPA